MENICKCHFSLLHRMTNVFQSRIWRAILTHVCHWSKPFPLFPNISFSVGCGPAGRWTSNPVSGFLQPKKCFFSRNKSVAKKINEKFRTECELGQNSIFNAIEYSFKANLNTCLTIIVLVFLFNFTWLNTDSV